MEIYLPIAELSVNVVLILGMGAGVGFLSGLFGVGGGFLMTPLLIFVGIPPTVAVATEANHVVASSVSGVLAHWRRGNVDVKMGLVLLAGGAVGSTFGVWLFTLFRELGQVDLVIRLAYVFFLGIIGAMMLVESARVMLMSRKQVSEHRHRHYWIHGLPLKTRFRRSRLYISVVPPVAIGFLVGVLAAIMGVGGGFIMVPAMIYLLGMPTSVVVGTSLFQIIFVTSNVTFLQAVNNQTVDVVLAFLLMVGGVVGAQMGARAGTTLRAEHVRGLLAMMVLAVCARLTAELVSIPLDIYSTAGVSVRG
jgi:uncharacterized membrane protein YfcA